MFDSNYNCEITIKKWAKILMYFAYVIMGVSAFASLIIIFVNAKLLWSISLATLVGGVLFGFAMIFASHLTWGFGDIVGTLGTKDCTVKKSSKKDNNSLPEL